MNACLKTAAWLGAALPMFAAMIDVTAAQAQSSATSRRAAQRGQATPHDAAAAAGARA